MSTSIAQRVYAVRLALGDGWKTPMPMADFAALLKKRGGETRFDSSVVSRIESGDRKLTLSDVAVIAAVDPLQRGKLWLGWGEQEQQRVPLASYQIPNPMASALAGEPPTEGPIQEPAQEPKPAERPRGKTARGKR